MLGGGRSGYNSPEGFRDVAREVWFAPGLFFRRLDPDGGWLKPALFTSFVLYLNLLLGELLQEVWLFEFNYGLLYAALAGLAVSLVLGPLLVAGLTALVLTILDGSPSRHKFRPVFRALGYASAIGLVLWLPLAPIFALPYSLYVATVAVREVLYIDYGRAAAAALIPLGAVLLILLLLTGFDEARGLLINLPGT